MRKFLSLKTPMVLAGLLFVNTAAWGHSKTDLITVRAGDTLTGAINNMAAGKLSLSTDYAGTISIKWREIEQIESRYLYEVRLDAGERLYGRFVAGDTADQLTFSSHGQNRQLDIDDIVEVRSIEDNLEDKLDLQLSSTAVVNSGTRSLVLNATATYDVRNGRTAMSARVEDQKTVSEDDESRATEVTKTTKLSFSREFWRSRGTAQSYRVINAVYSSNDELGVDHRGSLGFGLGRYLIQDLGHELAISAGIQGVQERRQSCDDQAARTDPRSPDRETCNDTELFFSLNWHLYSFKARDMDISLTGNAYPSLSDWGRARGDLLLNLNWELFDSFFWTLSARTEIDNAGDRSDPTRSKSDYSLTTGITWKY
ncbi:MAG: DUF481 domain-containing protein [Luminiphilus sp.]|nr:DUF481 domain-containing protein [Luminiphilus sp.]